ncbi:YchJ family protein [soil metagenome]
MHVSTSMITCPCGSGKSYIACCEPYIIGKHIAATPEALMRSRYSAYTQANVEYIKETMQGEPTVNFDAEQVRAWAKQVEWLGLRVFGSRISLQDKNVGYVEFRASYRLAGKKQHIHEISEFHREEGRWYYIGGIEK